MMSDMAKKTVKRASKRPKPVAAKAGFTKTKRRYEGGGKLK